MRAAILQALDWLEVRLPYQIEASVQVQPAMLLVGIMIDREDRAVFLFLPVIALCVRVRKVLP